MLTANAAKREGHFFKSLKGENLTTENICQHFGQWFSLPEGTEWRLVSQRTNRQGMTRLEYRQFVGGVEVEHSQVLLHVKDGQVMTANGTVMEADKMPTMSRQYGNVFSSGTPTDMMGRKLYLVYTADGYRYATKTLSADRRNWIYTDTETGRELKRVPTYKSLTGDPVKVTGKTIYSGDKEMDATLDDNSGSYVLYDQQRNIHTFIGSALPSMEEMVAEHTFLENMPDEAENLPVPEEEMTEELWAEWVQNFDIFNADFTHYILRNVEYASSTKPVFSAYKFNTISIDKVVVLDEDFDASELAPTEEEPLLYSMEIRYGDNGNGLIQRCIGIASNLPITFDLTENIDELPAEGVTIQLYQEEDFSRFLGMANDDDDVNRTLLVSLSVVPDASGVKVWDTDEVKASVTYEPSAWSASDIHWGMERTYDFYKEVFDRDSYDGEGAPIYNLFYMPDDMTEYNYFLSTGLDNASAAKVAPYPMVYGSGDNKVSRPVVELSVMAHEFTHLITTNTAGLAYEGESGALDESFADIMGINVKKYVYGNDASWAVGERIWLQMENMRDMAQPKLSGGGNEDTACPDTYCGEYWVDTEDTSELNDNGGVHANSGVQNKWYFLLTDGGSGTNDNDYTYSINGIGIEKSRQIAYLTLTEYATAEAQYDDIRLCSYQAAQDLYGETSVEAKTVLQAWDAVGVIDEDNPPTGISDAMHNDQQQIKNGKFYDLQGREITQPSSGIYVKDGRKVVVR